MVFWRLACVAVAQACQDPSLEPGHPRAQPVCDFRVTPLSQRWCWDSAPGLSLPSHSPRGRRNWSSYSGSFCSLARERASETWRWPSFARLTGGGPACRLGLDSGSFWTSQRDRQSRPWVEKYRPQTLNDLISHQDILSTIQKFISEDRLPHLLLYGPPGTGKTSTILACAKQLYKDKEFNSMVLELNASDDRGIDIVRGPILSFASTRTIFKKGFKLVILDEADAMTQDAQNALRRVIEKFTENTRFCLICNYLSKIIPALQSRCTRFRFGPLTPELMVPRLEHVVQEEKVDISEDGMKALVTLSSGDMRRALNILQSTNMAFGKVTEETVYTCTGHPLKSDIANILDWMLNLDFTTAYRNIMELKTLKGLALHDILTEVHLFVHRVDFPSSVRVHLLAKMADIEYRLSVGTSEKIQLSSLIAAFQVTRDLIVAEA
ncbi:replication factor C subunit 5-like isoform X1 [Dipodomys merriami]|uniref:replication factor C subunit 5-like isoform X1 n=2 Tax=Dipodomys merriami TaxID=94247 RepID=UPI003855D84C